MWFYAPCLFPFFFSLLSAEAVPVPPGFQILWSDEFPGGAGEKPDLDKWLIATSIDTNHEMQIYTDGSSNLQISGGNTVQLVPKKTPSGHWTSSRIETREAFMPASGGSMMMEATIRFGDHPEQNKQGIWPALWMLGDAVRHGTGWPQCGELDILEVLDGRPQGFATAHCSGSICNEPTGRQGVTAIPDNSWHRWTIKIDRTPPVWQDEIITWMMDGKVFHSLRGADIGDEAIWATLAHSPFYIILNVAVGGDWPGPPNAATLDNWGSMMEVGYVAVFASV